MGNHSDVPRGFSLMWNSFYMLLAVASLEFPNNTWKYARHFTL